VFVEDMPNDVFASDTGASLRINKVRALIRKYAEKAVGDVFLVASLQEAADKAVELMK
jgi:hypothetical protein